MNHAHKDLSELYHPQHEGLPNRLKFFAANLHLNGEFWENFDSVSEYFMKQGNKRYYVETLVQYIRSLHDMLYLWRKGVLNNAQINGRASEENVYNLDYVQNAIFSRIINFLNKRQEYYCRNFSPYDSDSDEECDESTSDFHHVSSYNTDETEPLSCPRSSTDWRKFILITGRHGTGKSQILCKIISSSIEEGYAILVTAPTGILAAKYQNIFSGDILTDTVHGAFCYPVNPDERASVNWDIGKYDIVIIDEVAMITKRIFDHIVRTIQQIPVRPVVILAGDELQQQPLETKEGHIIQGESIFSDTDMYSLVEKYKLTTQYRVRDEEYESFLSHIRVCQPSQELLDSIQNGHVLCENSQPTDVEIVEAMMQNPDSTVLTVSRQACVTVNCAVIKTLFQNETPLAFVQCDYDMEVGAIYKDLKIIVTRNIDKTNGVVNGQEGIIRYMENQTIFVELGTKKIVPIYPMTDIFDDGTKRTCYPIVPSYALTITKSQGMNLKAVIIWFDSLNVPAGSAYVALSRIETQQNLTLITPMLRQHIKPVIL